MQCRVSSRMETSVRVQIERALSGPVVMALCGGLRRIRAKLRQQGSCGESPASVPGARHSQGTSTQMHCKARSQSVTSLVAYGKTLDGR